jgi:hypothetical protein
VSVERGPDGCQDIVRLGDFLTNASQRAHHDIGLGSYLLQDSHRLSLLTPRMQAITLVVVCIFQMPDKSNVRRTRSLMPKSTGLRGGS